MSRERFIRVVRELIVKNKAYSRLREAITVICAETFTVAFRGFHLDRSKGRTIGQDTEINVGAIGRSTVLVKPPCGFVFHFLVFSLGQKWL